MTTKPFGSYYSTTPMLDDLQSVLEEKIVRDADAALAKSMDNYSLYGVGASTAKMMILDSMQGISRERAKHIESLFTRHDTADWMEAHMNDGRVYWGSSIGLGGKSAILNNILHERAVKVLTHNPNPGKGCYADFIKALDRSANIWDEVPVQITKYVPWAVDKSFRSNYLADEVANMLGLDTSHNLEKPLALPVILKPKYDRYSDKTIIEIKVPKTQELNNRQVTWYRNFSHKK